MKTDFLTHCPATGHHTSSNSHPTLASSSQASPHAGIKRLKLSVLAAMTVTALAACSSLPAAQSDTDNKAARPAVSSADTHFADDDSRHEYQLDNGLKVIIKEDHRAPVAMTQIWYGVGSTDEPKDKGGISHLLEHMMFKGTKKVSGADFDRLIAKFGGDHNAFTSYDYTGYYEMFPVNRLDLALELESDRMVNLRFDSDEFVQEFAQERNVVMEERRQRTDDNPLARAFEKFRKMALPDSPKGESVIGPMDEIANTDIKDLQQWYDTWYAPNNATLVIVGDVNPKETLKKVEHYFGSIKHKPIPQRPSVQQQAFRGYQQQTVKETVNVPTLIMAFNVPTLPSAITANSSDKEVYELLMLQYIMDGGYAARFEKNLVRKQGLLASVVAYYDAYERGDGLFMVQATPREGVSLAQAQKAIIDEMDTLKTQTISKQELERARNNAINGFVFSQDSMAGQANMIGSLQVRGLDDRLVTTLPDKLAKVTSADVNAAASKYLVNNNLNVMYVEPGETRSVLPASNSMPDQPMPAKP
ncbi:M16 family metallopeptidase [Psychrobacter sanguinis]|uniref:Insulinase family protein n=1 Tax=Psychrobacter sanguinis TaxID=861445 RepID=A0A844M061_9GAMM|nr:pitrilysin family protein [Psychrobacter sanguinis]MUG32312.1 insulinase family protein [Psychrobacter sanguinis]